MNRAIGGVQTYSKHFSRYGAGCPVTIDRAGGPYVWSENRCFVDFIAGLGPVILGHAEPEVDAAVHEQMGKGIAYPLASALEEDLAGLLFDIVPGAELTRFGKNGADATAAAVRLARAFTGRDGVISIGYHGYHDWSLDDPALGVPKDVRALTMRLKYGDFDALEAAFQLAPDTIACLITEPVTVAGGEASPIPDYLERCRSLCDQHGAILVYDEVVTGFRVALGGSQEAWHTPAPDLICLGKAMANGYPISALTGKALLMRRLQAGDVFFSTTFGGDCLGLAASLATLRILRRDNVLATLAQRGEMLRGAYSYAIRQHRLSDRLRLTSYPQRPVLKWTAESDARRFLDLMVGKGYLMQSSHNLMARHTMDLIAQTCRDLSACLAAL